MTELIWDGKYKDGKKVGPVRIALPFQTVETVNETAQERQLTLDMLIAGRETDWRNRLIWGDKKYVLPSLLPEFAGRVNLIYIDPPFATGADFSFTTTIPESNDSFIKEPSMIEQKAYRDTWGQGLDSYLQWFYETVVPLRELLAEGGSLYIHLDWHVAHYAKAVLDEIFGQNHCQNEIIWKRTSARSDSHTYNHIHDVIFLYTKGEHFTYNVQYTAYDQTYIDNFYSHYAQNTEALLERIITASSNEGDLVLDCFCGSGTTAAVAEKLGRRWITCDLGRFAIHTTRKRLLSIDSVRPFVVQNLGKYERQAWQAAEFADPTQRANLQLRYRNFILQLYNATPIDGYTWIHGIKGGRLVHVGSVDAPIALGEVKAIVNEFWRVRGKDVGEHSNGIDILGWDFAFDLNETAKQMAADSNIN